MKKILIILLILAVLGLAFYFLFGYKKPYSGPTSQPVTTPPPQSQSQTGGSEQTNVQTIVIQNFSFNPSPVTVKVGTTVTWDHQDTVPHQIVSDPSGADFKSEILSKGDKYFFTFQKVGNYSYHCGIHPFMKGDIIVEK